MAEADLRPGLPAGWWYVGPLLATALERQLARELLPGHRVAGRRLAALAKCDRNDDVLFVERTDGGKPVHWLVHLDLVPPGRSALSGRRNRACPGRPAITLR